MAQKSPLDRRLKKQSDLKSLRNRFFSSEDPGNKLRQVERTCSEENDDQLPEPRKRLQKQAERIALAHPNQDDDRRAELQERLKNRTERISLAHPTRPRLPSIIPESSRHDTRKQREDTKQKGEGGGGGHGSSASHSGQGGAQSQDKKTASAGSRGRSGEEQALSLISLSKKRQQDYDLDVKRHSEKFKADVLGLIERFKQHQSESASSGSKYDSDRNMNKGGFSLSGTGTTTSLRESWSTGRGTEDNETKKKFHEDVKKVHDAGIIKKFSEAISNLPSGESGGSGHREGTSKSGKDNALDKPQEPGGSLPHSFPGGKADDIFSNTSNDSVSLSTNEPLNDGIDSWNESSSLSPASQESAGRSSEMISKLPSGESWGNKLGEGTSKSGRDNALDIPQKPGEGSLPDSFPGGKADDIFSNTSNDSVSLSTNEPLNDGIASWNEACSSSPASQESPRRSSEMMNYGSAANMGGSAYGGGPPPGPPPC